LGCKRRPQVARLLLESLHPRGADGVQVEVVARPAGEPIASTADAGSLPDGT
jgi:hypothetical protein